MKHLPQAPLFYDSHKSYTPSHQTNPSPYLHFKMVSLILSSTSSTTKNDNNAIEFSDTFDELMKQASSTTPALSSTAQVTDDEVSEGESSSEEALQVLQCWQDEDNVSTVTTSTTEDDSTSMVVDDEDDVLLFLESTFDEHDGLLRGDDLVFDLSSDFLCCHEEDEDGYDQIMQEAAAVLEGTNSKTTSNSSQAAEPLLAAGMRTLQDSMHKSRHSRASLQATTPKLTNYARLSSVDQVVQRTQYSSHQIDSYFCYYQHQLVAQQQEQQDHPFLTASSVQQ